MTKQRILMITDTSAKHFNGVQLRLKHLIEYLNSSAEYEVNMISSDDFAQFYPPFFPELALPKPKKTIIKQKIDAFRPHFIHIETEGPLGLWVRHFCHQRNYAYTTCYHSRYDEFCSARIGLPKSWVLRYFTWFHRYSKGVMVRTRSMQQHLASINIAHTRLLTPGINQQLFRFNSSTPSSTEKLFLYVGRIAPEKNLTTFLNLDLPGKKVLIGDGPQKDSLQTQYPEAEFKGYLQQQDIVNYLNLADVFVFPSRSETLGNVILEANACGLPVAALPAPGPIDLIEPGLNGFVDNDLTVAIAQCLKIKKADCAAYVKQFSLENSAESFVTQLVSCNEFAAKAYG